MEKMLNVFIEKNINQNGFQEYLINSFSPTLKNYYSKYSIETYKKLVKRNWTANAPYIYGARMQWFIRIL